MCDISRSNPILIPRRPGLADKRRKSGLQRAYWKFVAARRAAGEDAILPSEYTEESFPGPMAWFAFPIEDGEEDPDKPMLERCALELLTVNFLPCSVSLARPFYLQI